MAVIGYDKKMMILKILETTLLIEDEDGNVLSSMEAIVNAWIRLTAFYGISMEKLNDVRHFFVYQTITSLDLLHESTFLRNGHDIRDFARVIPTTTHPQQIFPFVFKELFNILKVTGNINTIGKLYISLDYPAIKPKMKNDFNFEFKRTFTCSKLKRLIVHGSGADNGLMAAIGSCCKCLEYLDIRGSSVTEYGILLLLFKQPKVYQDMLTNGRLPRLKLLQKWVNTVAMTLEYLDFSTVKHEGILRAQDRIVTLSCPKLRGTMNRVFFNPGGVVYLLSRSYDQQNFRIEKFRRMFLLNTPREVANVFIKMLQHLSPCFYNNEFINAIELRHNPIGEECGVIFMHQNLMVMEFQLEHLTIVSISSHGKCTTDFIPISALAKLTPNLRTIKASLCGVINRQHNFWNLQQMTIPMVKSKDTLISLLKYSRKLVYVEVGEMLLTPTQDLCDNDIEEIFMKVNDDMVLVATGHENLEIFRILFKNQITINPGLKTIFKVCPALRVIGDLKYWNIPFKVLQRFAHHLHDHNYDLMFEHRGLLYHPSTPFKELYH